MGSGSFSRILYHCSVFSSRVDFNKILHSGGDQPILAILILVVSWSSIPKPGSRNFLRMYIVHW